MALSVLGTAGQAQAAPVEPTASQIAAQFVADLKTKSSAGDTEAKASLNKYEKFSASQKQIFNEALKKLSVSGDTTGLTSVGSSGTRTTPAANTSRAAITPRTTVYNVTAYCNQDFVFFGILVTRVRVTGYYQTGLGRVLAVNGVRLM